MEIYVYGLVGLFAGHLLVIYLFNNMEPEKKDVWALFDEKFVREDGLMDKYIYLLEKVDEQGHPDVRTTAQGIKDFIRQNFIPRAEVVERIEKKKSLIHLTQIGTSEYQAGQIDTLDNLLDLIKNNE